MDILTKIKSDTELADKVDALCDIWLYEELQKPEDVGGRLTYNIPGMAFGKDASGGEFILLDDHSIGLMSSEGETGRIAENIKSLFSLLVNCPCFYDFLGADLYEDDALLKAHAQAMEEEYKNDFEDLGGDDYDTIKAEIAEALGLIVEKDIATTTLKDFYHAATREPQFQCIFKEEDGTETISSCIISR